MLKIAPIRFIHRLHFKVALFVISSIVVIFGLFAVYQLFSYRQKLTAMKVESSELLCQTLTSCLEIAMLNSDLEAIQYSFEKASQNEDIGTVFLLNKGGEVRASSQPGMIGSVLTRQDPGCRECHSASGQSPLSETIKKQGEPFLRIVTPIENKVQCHSCHGDTARWNGVLVLDQSLDPVHAEFMANVKLAGIVATAAVLIMMFLFRWYIKRQIISRLEYLESLARRVTDNELPFDIELPGNDELSSLANSLNNMKNSLHLSLRAAEDHRSYLSHLLDNLIDGILIVTGQKKVAFINSSFVHVLGIDKNAVRSGDTLHFDRSPLNEFPHLLTIIEEAQASDVPIKQTLKFESSGVTPKYLEIHAGVLSLPPRRESETIVVVRDITSRVIIENQVYQSEKLATVGRLAAGIAHEINNPMASIMTCAEGLLKREPGNRNAREYLDIIKSSAQRCKMITQKLLDYSAAPTSSTNPVRLADVLQESVSLLRFEAQRQSVRIAVHPAAPHATVAGSKDSLVQVFVNLLLNGIQATKTGGEITVTMSESNGHVDVLVNDNGVGIDATHREKVFEPFFTTKPIGTGTGLGLSVSQAIVAKHGGTIALLESRKGFTSIRVSLPLIAADSVRCP